jgi:hypothetical protein
VPVDWARASPPAQDRQAIQNMISRGTPQRDKYVSDRKAFLEAYKKWKKSGSEADRQGAIAKRDSVLASRDRVKANRDSVIAKVDSTYDTREPAGTNVQYDPECTDYGYTSSRCFVRICEPSFESPDDVATTKIHEFEHVRQKQAGKWGPGNTPQPCTRLYHELEYAAYEAEMDADFGKRTSLSTEVKLEILTRKVEHLQGLLDALGVDMGDTKIKRALPGSVVEQQVTLTNESGLDQAINGHFENQQGWPMLPGTFSCYVAAERETTFTVAMAVPPGAELGTGNEVLCNAMSGMGDLASDFFFVNVIPVAEVKAGPNISGRPGHWVAFQFTVVNEGPNPDQFDVNVASVLGWTLAQSHWLIALTPGASAVVQSSVVIPYGAPHTTDLLLCTAMSLGVPGQADSNWVYAEIEEGSSDVDGREVVALALMPNVPNPFIGGTTLRFALPSRGPVDLAIYDVTGRLVKTLLSGGGGAISPGVYAVDWDGRDNGGGRVAGGVYFARLRAGNQGAVRKMVVLK